MINVDFLSEKLVKYVTIWIYQQTNIFVKEWLFTAHRDRILELPWVMNLIIMCLLQWADRVETSSAGEVVCRTAGFVEGEEEKTRRNLAIVRPSQGNRWSSSVDRRQRSQTNIFLFSFSTPALIYILPKHLFVFHKISTWTWNDIINLFPFFSWFYEKIVLR